MRRTKVLLLGAVALGLTAPGGTEPFEEARIFIEYNFSDNDLGFHVFLDDEDWEEIEIIHPNRRTLIEVEASGGFGKLGLTELFFEGAEPNLDEFPLARLLGLFPEGKYKFIGERVDGVILVSRPMLTHAVPAPTEVEPVEVNGDVVAITWSSVSTRADGFPPGPIEIVAYQVIVDSFQVTVPATGDPEQSITLPPEFVASLDSGEHGGEVLVIEEGANQTITQFDFEL